MVDINGTHITMTRGDTLTATLSLYDASGNVYVPESGDEIRFALKRRYSEPTPKIYKVIPNDTLVLEIRPEDTKQLCFGNYVYDIQMTYASGQVDTFIDRAVLTLCEEVD